MGAALRSWFRSRPALLAVGLALVACGTSTAGPIPPAASPSASAGLPSNSPTPAPSAGLGPGGLTLDQEVGTVIMVGFQGPATPAILSDWSARHFGGFLVIARNANGSTPAEITAQIRAVRAAVGGTPLVATDQEGGQICLAAAGAPCAPAAADLAGQGPAGVRGQYKAMACGIRGTGFNTDLAPVADLHLSSGDVIGTRSFGADPVSVGADVAAGVAGIHDCGMVAVAKHFPGLGGVTGDPEVSLPGNPRSLAQFQAEDWRPYRDAVAAGVDMIMVTHELAPALDPAASTSVSAPVIAHIRSDLGFNGAVISDDMQMGALAAGGVSAPQAALTFLEAGGDMAMIAHDQGVADQAWDLVRQAVLSGAYPRSRLDASVTRLLAVQARLAALPSP